MIKSGRFIAHFIWLEKLLLARGLLFTALFSTFTWVGPKVIAYIIDEGVIPHRVDLLYRGVLFLAIAELGRLSTSFLSQWSYASLAQNVIERVRSKMVSHLMKLPVTYYDSVTSGSMMTRVVNDVNSLTDFFQSGFVSILGNLASIVAIFVGLWSIHFKLGLSLFASFIPITIACVFFSRELRSVYDLTRTRLSYLNSALADFLFGMKTIRSLGLNEAKQKELNAQIESYAEAQSKMVRTYSLFHPTLTFGTGILVIILIWQGLPLIAQHELKVGQWIAALSYIVAIQQPLTEISDRWNFFLSGVTSIERIRQVFHEKREVMGGQSPARFESIELNHLCFAYAEASSVLRGLNFRINHGDWIGIHGESGSGKSTFLQMIYGFYSPTQGEITWNGQSYSKYDLAQLRSHFGVVEQFPFLFTGTIRDNLTLYGEHSFVLESIQAEFKGFPLVESLLLMLDQEVTERGGNLSMGQKQMIAFLRAYLARADIWILDEATAFFDQEAEREVIQALRRLHSATPRGITVIQVAHRPEALNSMHRSYQMNQGQLA